MDQDPTRLAEELRARMQAIGLALGYDRGSVAHLAAYLEQSRASLLAEPEPWLELLGAFLGQCLIEAFGGRWERPAPGEAWRVALGSADKTVVPRRAVQRQLAEGPAVSVLVLYDAVAADKTRGALGHGSQWGINTGTVCCPRCGAPQPSVRMPRSFKEMLWGGWTCQGCGTAMDKWGRERPSKKK
jgi:hypothetical protein